MQQLRILSLNVGDSGREVSPFDWNSRKGALFAQVKAMKPHVICFQEVVFDEQRGLNYRGDIWSEFNHAYRMVVTDFPTNRFDNQYLMTLVRNDLTSTEPEWVYDSVLINDPVLSPHDYQDEKVTAIQRVVLYPNLLDFPDGGPIAIYNTHFHPDTVDENEPDFETKSRRMKSARALGAYVQGNGGMPFVVVGDFNTFPSDGIYRPTKSDA